MGRGDRQIPRKLRADGGDLGRGEPSTQAMRALQAARKATRARGFALGMAFPLLRSFHVILHPFRSKAARLEPTAGLHTAYTARSPPSLNAALRGCP